MVEYKIRARFPIWNYLRALFNFPSLQSDAQGKTSADRQRGDIACNKRKKKKKTKNNNKMEELKLKIVASHVSLV